MKTTSFPFIPTAVLVAFVAISTSLSAKDSGDMAKHPDGIVSVTFENMSEFTDFGSDYQPSERDQRRLADKLRDEIKTIAPRYIPADHHLALRFIDINLAGEFEPERGPNLDGVRVVRGIYRPSFDVEYRVTDRAGEVVSSGQRRITDLAFQNVISFRRDEPLFYELELARDLISDISRTF